VIHPVARRLLPRLLDGDLPPSRQAALLRHLEGCRRCRRARAEFELSEALLRRLPAALVPLVATPEAEERLRALARWGEGDAVPGSGPSAVLRRAAPSAAAPRWSLLPGPLLWRSWSVPALGTAAAAGLLALLLSVAPFGGGPPGDPGRFELAHASLQDLYLMPGHIR